MMDNSEEANSVEFKIKAEELIIKDEVEDPTYELTATEVNNDSSEDQRQFVIIKSDTGPPHHIFDRFTNTLIKVNKILSVKLVNLPENVALSKIQINSKKQDVNGPSTSTILEQGNHKCLTIEKRPYKCQERRK